MANHELSMESIDSGSNYSFGDKMLKPKNPRSLFDLSHLSTCDIYNAGAVVPICSPIEVIMGDDIEIDVSSLIRVLPQEVPLYSRQRLYIYAFYSRCSDLWENWNVFAKKGMLGTTIKEIPTLNSKNFRNGQLNDNSGKIVTNSLGDYMGLPIGLDPTNETWSGKINALPFMMYTRIWRDYFVNKNTLAGNPAIFPDNDDHFRLDDAGRLISAKDMDYIDDQDVSHEYNLIWGSSGDAEVGEDLDENEEWLRNNAVKYGVGCAVDDEKLDIRMGIFYHNWPDDRFTDALPWPQRGDTPKIEMKFEGDIVEEGINSFMDLTTSDFQNADLRYYDMTASDGRGHTIDLKKQAMMGAGSSWSASDDWETSQSDMLTVSGIADKNIGLNKKDILSMINENAKVKLNKDITLNMIRELAIAQTELEKMARTDGTYLGFAMTFFNERPKNAVDYKPVYIGGCYTDLNFTEVIQTGSATGGAPLGTYAGHGIGALGGSNGYLGRIHCDDFGYIMLLGCIMPDVYYSQQVQRMWTRKFQSDIYLPERAKMGMTPVYNYEIDGLHAPAGKTLFDLWAWNNPYDELRYRANEIHGQIADPSKASFFSYTQSRHFDSAPNWGKEFSEAKDVRMDYLATGNLESAYTAQFAINIRAVRELPYKPVPAQII